MKILYITTIGGTMGFFISFIRELLNSGHTVDIATNETESTVPNCYHEWGCKVFPLSCSRSSIAFKNNFRTIREIKRIVEGGKYDLVHCHTPIAAACTRIACMSLRKKIGLRVMYTAHGFHFYDGAPLKNWLIFYPIEWLCSWWTDVLITINKEDYERASSHFHAKKIVYVPGVGIDTTKFAPLPNRREKIRAELGLGDNKIMILSVGELNENKNHETVIKTIASFDKTCIDDIVYVIIGSGKQASHLQEIVAQYGIDVRLMGHRSNVSDYYDAADLFILPSYREGLSVSLMEAMASGLAICCGKIRGNTDLICDENCLFDPTDMKQIRKAIEYAIEHKAELGRANLEKVKTFDFSNVRADMNDIYKTVSPPPTQYRHLAAIMIWQTKRREIGVPFDAKLLISVGELSKNKNQSVIIKALGLLKDNTIHYAIAGNGSMLNRLKELTISCGVSEQVHLLGHRNDIPALYASADICVFPSIREGLGLAAIEGMASGLPLIVADNRGTRDYVGEENGIVCRHDYLDDFSAAIRKLVDHAEIRAEMGMINLKKSAVFDISRINSFMKIIY